ncbi:four helix bundle protein [Candidatus Uhrbacteria bacterium]|nr:four helix bundle protein [Candidatus Uhrbacteria bacterium]MBD3283826.1 four helix bundle protein [Candidatus Uhrbacteria bacterium]
MKDDKDLSIRMKAIQRSKQIYPLTAQASFASDFALSNQIHRAVISISSNSAEGDDRNNNKASIHLFRCKRIHGRSAKSATSGTSVKGCSGYTPVRAGPSPRCRIKKSSVAFVI